MAKTYTKQSESGEGGIALVKMLVTRMGFLWHDRRVDHGVDGEVELVDRGRRQPLNRTICVQSKARERFPGEDSHGFHYMCEPDDVDYWLQSVVPVILVCSHPATGEAWWAPVSEIMKDPRQRRSRRITFDKQVDRFDTSAASLLMELSVPPSGGLYVPTTNAHEVLTSNLLAVESFPGTLWATPATVAGNEEAWRVLRQRGVYEGDWMVLDRTLFSFRRTDDEPFSAIVDGTAEAVDSSEWSQAKSADTCRNFVRLLNHTLAEQLHEEVRRHPKRHYLYFRPTDDLYPRRLSTRKSKSGRAVFQGYPTSVDPANARHFRHHALEHQFVRLGRQWFLELAPTYHFTSDGYHDLPWGAELVKGIKRREKNAAVRGLVEMWASYLTGQDTLLGTRDGLPLRFGELEPFAVESGIDERAWKRAERVAPGNVDGALTLFEAS